MSKFPMTQDEEERQLARARALHASDTDDGDDGVQCRRCGTPGLYWQRVIQADGLGDRSVLFNADTKRRHVCEPDAGADAFEAVPE